MCEYIGELLTFAECAEFMFYVILTQKYLCEPLGGILTRKNVETCYDFMEVVEFG